MGRNKMPDITTIDEAHALMQHDTKIEVITTKNRKKKVSNNNKN